MCKSDKSFNTGVQTSYLSSHENALQKPAGQAGLRPVPTLWLDQPPLGMSKKTDCLKTTRERRALSSLSWLSWTVELVEATLPVFAATPSNARRSAGRSPRNQPSEGV